MKIMIFGHGRHGKDTAANVLAQHMNCRPLASSWVACQLFLFKQLKQAGYGYNTPEEAWEDRLSSNGMRQFWFERIRQYNDGDRTRLMRGVYRQTDIYIGIRCRDELTEGIKTSLVDLAIWVDAAQRLPCEPQTSITCTREQADIVIDNNGTEGEFLRRVNRLAWSLRVA